MTPCGAPAPDTVRPEPDRQAKPGPLYVTAHRDLLRSASLLRELPAVAVAHRGGGYPSPAVTSWSVARSPLAAADTVPDRPIKAPWLPLNRPSSAPACTPKPPRPHRNRPGHPMRQDVAFGGAHGVP